MKTASQNILVCAALDQCPTRSRWLIKCLVTDHCIDTLRQWLMCQPDLTLRSVYWREDGQSVAANNSVSHECVDWSALQGWVDAHTIDPIAPVIQRPDGTLECKRAAMAAFIDNCRRVLRERSSTATEMLRRTPRAAIRSEQPSNEWSGEYGIVRHNICNRLA